MYGLRYTISQALRNEDLLKVSIYEKGYTDDIVTTYQAVSISLEPNSTNDEPLPAVVSSQLNVSFVISEEDAAADFPDLLSFDDRKYYVELTQEGVINKLLWAGFLFNDYVNIPYTTGNNQVDILAIDGLSFLRYKIFEITDTQSQNDTINILDFMAEALNIINFPNAMTLKTWCSYYAAGMLNRGDLEFFEPFQQSFQYKRDYLQIDYYTILENIMQSFGCRLFQANGSWQIMAINEMAGITRWYTEYNITPTVSLANYGTDSSLVTVKPYQDGEVYFINNSQTKISRKGYPTVIVTGNIRQATNYCHNGTFKQLNSGLPITPVGWTLSHTGTGGHAWLIEVPDDQFNYVDLFAGNGPSYGTSVLQSGVYVSYTAYLPYMIRPSIGISFQFQTPQTKAKLQVSIRLPSGTTYYWNDSSKVWQTGAVYMDVTTNTYGEWVGFSKTLETGGVLVPSGVNIEGYVGLKFTVDGSSYKFIQIRNVQITQSAQAVTAVQVTREIGIQSSITKEIDQPYGNFDPNNDSHNNVGYLINSAGNALQNWYRYGMTGTYYMLANLLSRQMSNLLTKNFGTLEGDLGAFEYNENMIYLDKTYTIQDSITNALSYNGRKFLANRMSVIPQMDQISGFQIIEITNDDNASIEKVDYIGDEGIGVTPRRYF